MKAKVTTTIAAYFCEALQIESIKSEFDGKPASGMSSLIGLLAGDPGGRHVDER